MVQPKNLSLKQNTVLSYKRFFDSPDGERILYDLIKSSRMLHTTHDDNPHVAAFNEGRRALVCQIITTAGMDERKYIDFLANMQKLERNV